MKKKIKIILLIIWMIVIFMFSNQVAIESTKLTKQISNTVIEKVDSEISTETKTEITNKIFLPFRKSAHLFVYFILGILIYSLLTEYQIKHKIIYSIIFVILYATSDEIHQIFVPGRSSSYIDICIDTIGGITGILLTKLSIKIIDKIKNKKQENCI